MMILIHKVFILWILCILLMVTSEITKKMEIKLEAYEVLEKVVKASGNSGRVYVPIDWVGKRVKILLIEPLDGGFD